MRTSGWPSPEQNGGIRLLRRGYNYTDGQDPDTGKLAAGLFFIAFQRDPQAQFKVLQTRLGKLRPAQRVHRAHRRRAVGLPAGGQRARRLVRPGPVPLTPTTRTWHSRRDHRRRAGRSTAGFRRNHQRCGVAPTAQSGRAACRNAVPASS